MAKIRRQLEQAEWAKLPRETQDLYTERNGKYLLDADDAEELHRALLEERRQLTELRGKLAGLEGLDPEKYRKLEEDAAKASRQRDLDQGNFEKVLGEERTAHAGELAKRDKYAEGLVAQLNEHLVDNQLLTALGAYPGAKPKLIIPAAKQKIAVKEIGGRLRAVVLNEKGEARLRADAKNADDYMGPPDLIAEMRNDKEYAGAFPANAPRDNTLRLMPPVGPSNTEVDQVNAIVAQVKGGATKLS